MINRRGNYEKDAVVIAQKASRKMAMPGVKYKLSYVEAKWRAVEMK